MGVAVDGVQKLCSRRLQQLAEIGVEVGKRDLTQPLGAEIHDTVDAQGREVIGHVAQLQALEQAADHRRLADPAAPDHRHHPQARVLEEIPDLLGFVLAILEPGGRRGGRSIDEFRDTLGRDRLGRLALALQGAFDALRGSPGSSLRVRDGLFLCGDLFPQLLDLLLNAGPFGVFGPPQVALGIGEPFLEPLQQTFGG
jgi:hypothetical protein